MSDGSFPEGEGGKNPCRLLPTDALRMPLFSLGRYYAIAGDSSNSAGGPGLEMGSPRTLEGGTVPVSEGRVPIAWGAVQLSLTRDTLSDFPPASHYVIAV